jgi:transposase
MISPGAGVSIAAGVTDIRRGFDGLAAMVQQQLGQDPFSGALFLFRGRRGHLLKILAWDGQALVLYAKRAANSFGRKPSRAPYH